jgi:hypothetical protein
MKAVNYEIREIILSNKKPYRPGLYIALKWQQIANIAFKNRTFKNEYPITGRFNRKDLRLL